MTIFISNKNAGLRTLVSTRDERRLRGKGVAFILTSGDNTCTLGHTRGTNVRDTIISEGRCSSGRTCSMTILGRLRGEGVSLVILTKFLSVLNDRLIRGCEGGVVGVRPDLVPLFYNSNFCNLGIRRTILTDKVGMANTATRFIGRVASNNTVVLRGTIPVRRNSAPRVLRCHIVHLTR